MAEPEQYDTPTQRATITQLQVDELDAWLTRIRERRLTYVRKLEAAAKVRADEVRLDAFLKLERALVKAQSGLRRLEAEDAKVEKLVHKCRLLAMAALMEVEQDERESA